MKNFITQLFRLLVGALFVFSGFVKLIDPLGSAYKFTEYFGADVLNMEFLIPYALPFSIFLIIAEIMLGVMLLVGYKSKFTIWSLLILILVFLFLTWYSAFYNVVQDCGCFGDAVKLTSWETFYKNVILVVMILWLLFNDNDVRPFYSNKLSGAISTLFLLGFGALIFYVLHYLPIIDFRPYAVGKNIPEQMIYPEGAKEDVFDMTFIYKVNGVDKEFKEDEKPWEIKGAEYVDRKTVLVEKGYEPPIHDFTMERKGKDLTNKLMKFEKLMIIVSYDIEKANKEGFANIQKISEKALNNGYTVVMMSASTEEDFQKIKKEYNLDFELLYCDETALKTIIRSNPGILTVNKGTIEGKWSYNDIDNVKIKEGMGRRTISLDFGLKASLDSIFKLDQKYRAVINANNPRERDSLMLLNNISKDSLGTDFWEKQVVIDKSNMQFLDNVIKENGYPGRSLVGEVSKDGAAKIIEHSGNIGKYMTIIKKAAADNEMTYTKAAIMEDIYLMQQNKEQLYGTQTAYINDEYIIWPIKDFDALNYRRKEAGFDLTIYEYAKELFGSDYVFEPVSLEDVLKDKAQEIDSIAK